MNEDEVRDLLGKAASGPVDVGQVDPEAIVRAGKRGAIRARVGIAVAGGAAAVLALGAAVGIPMAFGDDDMAASGGAAPEDLPTDDVADDFLDQWTRADHGNCPLPDQAEEKERTAAAYTATLFEGLADLGGEPLGNCLTTRPDYDGFYDYGEGTYFLQEAVAFPGADGTAPDWAWLTGSVWETGGVDYESQMEEEECTYSPGLTCSWIDSEEGRVLLMEGTRTDFLNPDTEEGGSADFPMVGAFLFREDVVLSLGFSLRFESDQPGPTLEEVTEILKSIPVGQEAPEVEPPAERDLADELAAAVANAVPGAVVDTPSFDLVRLHADVAEYGGPVYGSEATHMVFVLAELESGETVRFYLQAEQVTGAGDEPAEEIAAAYAQCRDAECETATDDPRDVSVHRTIEAERPGLTALEYRTGDGWMIGVGVEAVDGTEAPPVDFATLDAIVGAIR
ncbi:hypothetical protein [Glycomyces harbinensis]|uniref:Uncharacterized protein n=1 Tax=Glycomyces harbinensis TaxID=58114 RepID=A0A1G7AB60_9ACTN|nr:hypothetical protein [Glycomyces harbinensis]SDE11990.1 hypothetical protein SAMN05216270_11339 [Glycomyces harbinensis]